MTTKDEALRLALEHGSFPQGSGVIHAIKQALEQPEQKDEKGRPMTYWGGLEQPSVSVEPEPVAWLLWLHGPVRLFLNKDEAMMELNRLNKEYPVDNDARQMKPLYTSPPKREPLTDEQIASLWDEIIKYAPGDVRLKEFARAIEAAHGIGEKK